MASHETGLRPTRLNIVLIGFMGCGKTTIGELAARLLGFRFVDMDDLIERKARCRIPKIFEEKGEAGFRKIESGVLKDLAGMERHVIATGGGVVTIPENVPLLRDLGLVIWLHTTEDEIYSRISRNRSRPLLRTPNPRQTLHELLEKRLDLYRGAADLRVDSTGLTPDEVAYGLCESARLHFCRSGMP